MRDVVVSDDLLRAIAESGGELRFVNARGEILGRFEPELTAEELEEIRRRLTSSEPRYTTDQVLQRLRSAPSP
jgi:CRISPR/Cas system-associated endonuclease Cas1